MSRKVRKIIGWSLLVMLVGGILAAAGLAVWADGGSPLAAILELLATAACTGIILVVVFAAVDLISD